MSGSMPFERESRAHARAAADSLRILPAGDREAIGFGEQRWQGRRCSRFGGVRWMWSVPSERRNVGGRRNVWQEQQLGIRIAGGGQMVAVVHIAREDTSSQKIWQRRNVGKPC